MVTHRSVVSASHAIQATSGGAAAGDDERRESDGENGTSRDLRPDRPLRGSRRLTTIAAESLYSCGFLGSSRFDSACLSEADFSRLLPELDRQSA